MVKLSICIPTYNRAAILERSLAHFREHYDLPFSFEIVISDNASTDGTADVARRFAEAGMPIRYYRQKENNGYQNNQLGAFARATGEYVIYLADDDRLLMDGLLPAVAYLDENPSVVACYAPWEQYEEDTDQFAAPFYSLDQDQKFSQSQFIDLFALITARHIFPEVGIYRLQPLRRAWMPRHFCYWAFAYLAHFLDNGDVAFLRQPFYLTIGESFDVTKAQRAGHSEAMTAWDRYRGGLEYYLYFTTKRLGLKLTESAYKNCMDLIDYFIVQRIYVACKLWGWSNERGKAYELRCRARFALENGLNIPCGDTEKAHMLDGLLPPIGVALQIFAGVINAAPSVTGLILHGLPNGAVFKSQLREAGLSEDIVFTSLDEIETPEQAADVAVVIMDEAPRELLLEAGFSPGLIFSAEDITRTIIP